MTGVMPLVRARLRAELRWRWRSWLALALMLGVIGGAVLTATAGARRTDSAYLRMRAAGHSADVLVSPSGTGLHGFSDALRRLPGVEADAKVVIFNTAGVKSPNGAVDPNLQVVAGTDRQLGFSMSRPKLVAGRMFSPQNPDEAVIDPVLAARDDLHPGSNLTLYAFPQNYDGPTDPAHAMRIVLRVTGIVVFDREIVPVSQTDAFPQVLTTPARWRETGPSLLGADGAYLRLRPGTDISVLHRQIDALAARYPADEVGPVFFANLGDQVAAVQRAVRPEVVALTVFAILLALVGLVVLGQLLARQVSTEAAEYPTLRALGANRRQLLVLSLCRAGVIALAGALLAVAAAIAASPLMPIGPARLAEIHPGVQVDPLILGSGFVLFLVLLVAVAAPSAWRAASARPLRVESRTPTPRWSVERVLAGIGRPLSLFVGLRMALRPGRGRSSVPVRGAVLGITVALAAITGAIVFGSSLDRLISTPSRYGQSWDVSMTSFGAPSKSLTGMIASKVGHVSAYSGGTFGQVTINGRLVPAVGIDRLEGDVFPSLLQGRPPARPGEIALGARTLRDADKHLGDDVRVTADGRTRTMRIVGIVVLPAFSQGSFTPTDLGQGAVTVASVFPTPAAAGQGNGYNILLFRLHHGASTGHAAAALSETMTKLGCPLGSCFVNRDLRPADISDYSRIRQTPVVLALVLGFLGVATLAYVLVSSIRQRRRELAMLKTLGFVRRQVSLTVAWQASAMAVLALVLGLPIGIALGRWVWMLFASSVGVASDASVPLLPVLLMVPAVLILTNLIAVGPGVAAGRVRTAAVLRSE